MPRSDIPLSPEELAAKTGYEKTPDQRQVALDAANPSQQRPKKVPCVWDRVDFMEWETWRRPWLESAGRRGTIRKPFEKRREKAMTWRLAPDPSGCRVIDHDGRERGRHRNANELATHLAFALR